MSTLPIPCFGGPMNGMYAEDLGHEIVAREGEKGDGVVYQRMAFCFRRANGTELQFATAYVHGDRPTSEAVFGAMPVQATKQ